MKLFPEFGHAWAAEMNAADRFRVVLAWGFIFGAVSHIGWVIVHGDVWYHGPGPVWAPVFWYSICVIDLIVYWFLLHRPRVGLVMSVLTMITTLIVNWTQFPTFQFTFNYVLIGLTVFGVIVFGTVTWLWRASNWRPNRDAIDGP
ncbi:MAG TPA: hypothetical protein VG942_03375 [Hyphomonadaceae bacterium]|nr:hypothetical protein [Hyphomonadaceae bacterium]